MNTRRPAPCHTGFTLLELLVVMVVLSLFLMMTTVVTRDAVELHGATKARLASERNAAAFLQQFEADLTQRVLRAEALTKVEKCGGDDRISWLTQRQGYAIRGTAADRSASLVSYRIQRHMMERAASGYGFGAGQHRPSERSGTLALKEIPATGPEEPAAKAFQVIAPGIIRLELSFLVREGETRVLRAKPPQDQTGIEAVIATIATLDPDRSRMLDETKLGLIAAAFPDAADNESPLRKWSGIAANLTRDLPQLPHSALQQVRVYQGIIPLPNPSPLP